MSRGQNTAGHPKRQVSRSSWSAAMDARTAEYEAVRSGAMSDEQARRVDINPNKVSPPKRTFISKDPAGFPPGYLVSGDRAVTVQRGMLIGRRKTL